MNHELKFTRLVQITFGEIDHKNRVCEVEVNGLTVGMVLVERTGGVWRIWLKIGGHELGGLTVSHSEIPWMDIKKWVVEQMLRLFEQDARASLMNLNLEWHTKYNPRLDEEFDR